MELPLPRSPIPVFDSIRSPILKEKFIKKRFIDYNLTEYLSTNHSKRCPNDLLRDLDMIRLHSPLKEEIELLNISDYRMNLHIKNDILYLCGGLVGVRFDNNDLTLILNTIKRLNILWMELDIFYKSMNQISKKMTINNNQIIDKNSIDNIIDNQQIYDNQQSVLKFQSLCDDYLHEMINIQDVIKMKQKEIDINLNQDSLKIDADPESKIGMKMPLWLTTLINKYELDTNTMSNEVNNNMMSPTLSSKKLKLNLGDLSIFLSNLFINNSAMSANERIQCSSEERDAISILIQASNDNLLSLSDTEMSQSSPGTFTNVYMHNKKYWANRFYAFLSKMTELSTAIKDDSIIKEM